MGILGIGFRCQSVFEDECEDEDDVLFSSFTRPRRCPRTRTRVFSNTLSDT